MPKIEINKKYLEYTVDPDHCPICHHGIEAMPIASNLISRKGEMSADIMQMIYRCPRQACQRAFIGTYRQNMGRYHSYEGPFVLRNTAPYYAEKISFPKEIHQISPTFIEIYSQCVSAEAYQLDQISGVGYRKSLEYLIKDYVSYKHPGKKENIEKAFLGACINEYVDDANVKECAKRAAWLGNDETHYVRKWEEKDIEDLKILIQLTQAWILNNLLTEKYLKEMK